MCTTRVVQSCVLDMRYRDTEKLGEEGREGGYKCGCWVFSVRDYHPCRAAGIFPFVSWIDLSTRDRAQKNSID